MDVAKLTKLLGMLLALGVAWPTASAQDNGFDGHNFFPVGQDGDPRDLIQTYRPGRFDQWDVFGTLMYSYSKAPLSLLYHYPDGRPDVEFTFLDDVSALNLNAGIAFHNNVRLEVQAPLFVASTGRDEVSNGVAMGDIRTAVMVEILRPRPKYGGGFGLAVVPWISFPTGDARQFLGASGVVWGAKVAGTMEVGGFTVTADAGPTFEPESELFPQESTVDIQYGAGLGYLLTPGLGLSAELRGTAGLKAAEFSGTGSPMELYGIARYRLDNGLNFTVGGGAAVTRGIGGAKYRLFAAVGFGKINQHFGDWDGDGVADEVDACEKEKETLNSYQDADGCPDDGGTVRFSVRTEGFVETDVGIRITDGTNVWDLDSALDPVPLELAAGSYKVKAGYPGWVAEATIIVTEGDKLVTLDLIEVTPGTLSIALSHAQGGSLDKVGLSIIGEGAPAGAQVLGPMGLAHMELMPGQYLVYLKSNDGALARKYVTIHPNENTHIDANLRNPRVVLTATKVDVQETIFFDTGAATIQANSFDLLEEIATLLIANPQIALIEIQGHTDDQGSEDTNLALSTSRAEAVRDHLVKVGVDPRRLAAIGFGERYPIASNRSEAGRAINRRVEFLIMEQTE